MLRRFFLRFRTGSDRGKTISARAPTVLRLVRFNTLRRVILGG